MEGDEGVGGGDASDEGGGGAGVVVSLDDEDGDGEAMANYELAELHHGDQMAHARRWV